MDGKLEVPEMMAEYTIDPCRSDACLCMERSLSGECRLRRPPSAVHGNLCRVQNTEHASGARAGVEKYGGAGASASQRAALSGCGAVSGLNRQVTIRSNPIIIKY